MWRQTQTWCQSAQHVLCSLQHMLCVSGMSVLSPFDWWCFSIPLMRASSSKTVVSAVSAV